MNTPRILLSLLLSAACFPAAAMEIAWTRTTGQFPVECTPVSLVRDGVPVVLALNRGGQVMLWRSDGSDGGPGQDGTVAQLPDGFWSSTPLVSANGPLPCLVACSGEGLVVALDSEFQPLWQLNLPGKTTYGNGSPTALPAGQGIALGDGSGTVTCINPDGSPRWQKQLALGPCRTPLANWSTAEGSPLLLAALGTTLCALDESGDLRWTRDLGVEILAGPTVVDNTFVLCGGGGKLVAVDGMGVVLWEAAVDEEMDNTISYRRQADGELLIVCKGLWGDLHAFNGRGAHRWTHRIRSKSRSKATFVPADTAEGFAILATSYDQEARLISPSGELMDLCHLAGAVSGAPLPLGDPGSDGRRYLSVTASLLAHCVQLGPCTSPYGPLPDARDVQLQWLDGSAESGIVRIQNPAGGLVRTNLAIPGRDGAPKVVGTLSTQSVSDLVPDGIEIIPGTTLRASVYDSHGERLQDGSWTVPETQATPAMKEGTENINVWPVPAYGDFDPQETAPPEASDIPAPTGVTVDNLYVDEIDGGAMVIASSCSHPLRARVTVEGLQRDGGGALSIAPQLFEVVFTGAFNGEDVADALLSLGDGGLVTLLPGRATKIWIQVDGHGATPGNYAGALRVRPILADMPAVDIPLTITIPNLRLPAPLPLTLCTWDYVPNQWFPERTPEVLDDMGRHGVTVFPRSAGMPPATVDGSGDLACDWSAMDGPLRDLESRGEILFHMGMPPITFSGSPAPESVRAAQLAYLRQWRDQLKARGWDYEDYALYPTDEPGLDYGKRIAGFLEAAQLFREADPLLRIYTDPVPSLSLADFERIEPFVDVWCPNMRLVSGLLARDPRMERIMTSGKTVWSYECVAQVRSLSPLRYNRANAWRARHFGLTGIGFWTHCTTQTDPWLRAKDFNEYELVYPGALPVPSVRWEAARDGLEDMGAIALLNGAIDAATGAGKHPELAAEARSAIDMATHDIMELSRQTFKESRDYLREGDRRLWHTAADVELYARHRARIASLTLALANE